MDDVRAGNSHHQVVIQASRKQSKYAAGLLCVISVQHVYPMYTPDLCPADMQKITEFHFCL